jgi:hypothetical protein
MVNCFERVDSSVSVLLSQMQYKGEDFVCNSLLLQKVNNNDISFKRQQCPTNSLMHFPTKDDKLILVFQSFPSQTKPKRVRLLLSCC